MSKIDYSKFGFREDYDPENRIVKQEYVDCDNKKYFISTIDLGIDHQFGEGEPFYYETMIFLKDSWAELYCERYTTRKEALKSHNKIIENFKNGLMTLKNGYFEIEEREDKE